MDVEENVREVADDSAPTDEKPPKFLSDVFDILELFTVCAAVILTVFTFLIRPTVVDGESMENTLLHGDYLLVQEIGYTPTAGDIVVVHDVDNAPYDNPIVKRIIATGGQTVDIDFDTWTVTVDGVVIDEPYRKVTSPPDIQRTADYDFPIQIPEGYVFVMGDNRNHSADSRTARIGLIDERCVVGKAVCRILPFSRITLFP